MGNYDVYVFCNHCGDVHLVAKGISIINGPNEKQSIGDAYVGKHIPEHISVLIRNEIQCPETGRRFVQEDDQQFFLVPVVYV
jgi:hypothetical protein